jgi:hypothetical protein
MDRRIPQLAGNAAAKKARKSGDNFRIKSMYWRPNSKFWLVLPSLRHWLPGK